MRKHVIHRAILLIGVVAALYNIGSVTACAKEDDDFLRGGGTKYNPYLISSYEDIVKLRDMVDDGNSLGGVYFRQTEDITFPDGINWDPIGSLADLNHAFAGVYDGNGHTLSNIYSEDQYAGVFSLLAGEVRNLGIESGYFHGSCVGSITSHGTETAKIINCYNKADVCGDARAGGIMDNFPGRALFCWNFGNVTGTNEGVVTAGITSYGEADVRYCYAVGADKLVSDATFTGKIADSELIAWEETSVYLQKSYEDMFALYSESKENEDEENKEKDLITRGNTVFIVCDDEGFHFDKEYEPEIFLAEKQEEKERFVEIWRNKYGFEGKGTKEEPFLISSYEDLSRLRDCVDIGVNYEEQYFEQTADINFPNGENWDPIGDLEHAFSGVYDGGGHIISNIYCHDKNAGIFSMLHGEVRNLGIESGAFHGNCIGSITSHGNEKARIVNCYNKADVTGDYRVGGLVDNFSGEILFSWNFGKVSSGKQDAVAAGISSYGSPKISYCYSTAEAEPVNPATFRGELHESGRIENAEVAERLRQNEAAYVEVIREKLIEPDDIIFLNVSGSGQLGFNESHIPAAVMDSERMGYLPECLLLGIVILLGMITLVVAYRYGKRRREVQKKEENDGLERIAVVRKFSWKYLRTKIRKRAAAVILTMAIFFWGFSYVMGVCRLETVSGVLNMEYWKKEENRNTDVLFVGSSVVTAPVDMGKLWKEKGIAGYNIAAGNAMNSDCYYRLVEADKAHSYKLAVVEVRGASMSTEGEKWDFGRLQNIPGVDMGFNKARYVNATLEPYERLHYFLDFPIQHGRYKELTKWDFLHSSSLGKDDKGNWELMYGSNNTVELEPAVDFIKYGVLDQKQEYYLRKIIEYCEASDRELLLLKTPDGNRARNQPFYNTVSLIAEEYGVPYLDMNQYDEEIGLTSADFSTDNWHLNVEGARKCTAFLGDYLMEHYTLLDHRGDEDYASWDRFAANREDLYLRAITDNKDYFDELLRDQRKIIVVSSGMALEKSEQYLSVKERLDDLEYEPYDAEDVLYGEENQNTWTLGSNTVTVQKDYQARKISINGKTNLSVESPGVILIVYDEVTDQVADVAAFTSANGFSVQHLYEGGDD